jgi:hypothetical protein
MDHQRFDSLTRKMASARSRRQVLKAAAGAAVGFSVVHPASAQTCGVLGDPCDVANESADCCNGLTCFEALCDNPSGLCMAEGEFCGSSGLVCCDGLECTSDYCEAISTLPGTGAGTSAGKHSLLGAGLLAAAAAFFAGKGLGRKSDVFGD